MSFAIYYYPARGRAQQIRYVLAEGGIAFEDRSSSYPPTADERATWLDLGKNTTTNVPMLTIGERAYTQSTAVLRLAARKGDLMPSDEDRLYQVDNIIAACDDFRSQAYKVIFGGDDDVKENFR